MGVEKLCSREFRTPLSTAFRIRAAINIRSGLPLNYAMAGLSISGMNLDGLRQQAGLSIS